MGSPVDSVLEAGAEKLAGRQPSRIRSLLAAVVIAGAAGILTYRLLRQATPNE